MSVGGGSGCGDPSPVPVTPLADYVESRWGVTFDPDDLPWTVVPPKRWPHGTPLPPWVTPLAWCLGGYMARLPDGHFRGASVLEAFAHGVPVDVAEEWPLAVRALRWWLRHKGTVVWLYGTDLTPWAHKDPEHASRAQANPLRYTDPYFAFLPNVPAWALRDFPSLGFSPFRSSKSPLLAPDQWVG